ncbi:hypothetical protein BXU11_05270 [Flavobacterium sp. LM5]|uniref:gliding motility-associated C-terminal domain-containing protein n=1 Tax=Flavobacterium sp. LM5 TaxID=1938610 RepID=UPI0009919FC5|nr:gliding motility-associated C-terminal domain-containing protein [Flavobacterium sp. LM5]OOV29327.1 hypothetical protein BXU11_05270 [Flavobacterium sp. LM5]
MIANDVGAAVSQDLQEVTNLDVTVRGIVSNNVLSNLGVIEEINIRSSDGVVDVKTTNTTLISRIAGGQTLHQGQADNAINDSWIGASADNIKDDASCPTSQGTTLKGNIIHTCGAISGMNWIPNLGYRRINDGAGNVAASVSFGLWLKGAIPPTITSVSPLTGCPDATITITGTNLATVQSVTIGGAAATVVAANATTITAKVGGNTGTVTVTTTEGIATSTDAFMVTTDLTAPQGSGCNPFTSINQVMSTTPNGSYFFTIGGTTFETKVENGFILIANDVGAPVSQDLQQVTNLDGTIRGIVSNTVLSNLGAIEGINIKSSDGVLDLKTTNTTLLNRIVAGQTLHQGQADNAINDSWTGTSEANIKVDATCTTTFGTSLNGNIIHVCGLSTGTTWIPKIGIRRIADGSGNVADAISFGLWVKPKAPVLVAGVNGGNLWLKADEGVTNSGSTVTGWTDQTGFNVFTKQGNIGFVDNAINFNPIVSFNNTDSNTVVPTNRLDGNTNISFVDGFAVYKYASSAKRGAVVGGTVSGSKYGEAVFAADDDLRVYVGNGLNASYQSYENLNLDNKFDINNLDVSLATVPYATGRLNSKEEIITDGSSTISDFSNIMLTPMIGGTNNTGGNIPQSGWYPFNGQLAEVIFYPNSLTVSDKVKVESYLAIKYGITLDPSVGNYVNSSGTAIWNNTKYWHDVFGIGEDDTSTLNQPQSNSINTGSGDGTGQSGKGNIVLSNPSSLNNGDFLIMGHDNGALTEQTTEVPTSGQNRIAREWRVKRSGDPGTVDLSFDIAGLTFSGSTANQFKLLIDADGDFSIGATSVNAGSLSGSKVVFNGLTLPDGFYLTIVTNTPGPSVTGANLWLKANEGVTNSGSNLTGWTDQTGTNTFTKQGTIGYQSNGINFNPTASFSNGYTTGVLPPNRLEGNTDINVVQAFAVYKNATSSPARTTSLFGRFDGNNNVTTGLFLGPTNDNTYVYFELNAAADAYLSFPSSINYDKFNLQTIDVSPTVAPFANAWTNGKNSLVEATSTGGVEYTAIPLTPLIGGTKNPSFFNFNGEVAEIITYNTGLSTFDKIKVESYLAVKYGITLDESVNNYVSSSGSSIWEYRTHWHDVFGIAKDDASSLNQSQSNSINTGSGDGTGQSGKGNIVLSNPSSLNNGDFLIMGHDNGALTEQTTEVPTSGQNRIAREWRVKRSGDIGTVDLSFDIAGLTFSGSTANQFKLLIDADGDFSSGATSVNAASLSGSKVVFNGVTLTNGGYLTIVTKTPGPGVSGANLWLKSNEGVTNSGSNVTGWTDQTGTNIFTKQGTIGYQTNGLNFNPIVNIDNSSSPSNQLPSNRFTGTTPIEGVEAFAIYKDAANSNSGSILSSTAAGPSYPRGFFLGNNSQFLTVADGVNQNTYPYTQGGTFHISNIDVSPLVSPFSQVRINGSPTIVTVGIGDFSKVVITPLIGGVVNATGSSYRHFNGQLAELILYSSALTASQKLQIESYLAIKYGITLNPSVVNYVNSSGTVLWNDTKYWHDVFGIGKDDASSLNQPQSNSINTGSGDGTGQSGRGNIVLSDPTSLDNGDFLMMGHDNAALTEQTTDLPTNLSGKKRLSREWKVSKANTPGTYNLSFDTTGLCLSASTAADFKLLVDSNADGEFIAATTIDAASYANNILYFTGVDLPNNAVFTFLTSPPTIQLTSAVGTDAQTVCTNTALTSIVYTTSKITNAVVTDLPAGVSANFSSNTLTISGTPTASGVFNYTIQLSSTQCPPLADVKGTITVTALPNKPSITTSGATSFCAPGSVVLNSSSSTGNQWYKDGSVIAGATSNSYTATDSGVYTLVVTQNGCVSVESNQVTVTANASPGAPTLNATGNTVICEGGSVRLHTSSLTGNKWFKNGIEIPGETSSDYDATSTGTYTVETINTAGCVSGLSTPIQVTVDPNKIVAPITGADSVCKGSSITLSSTTKTGVWNSSNTGIATIDGSGVVTGVRAGTVTITYSEANSSGCVTSVTKTITVIAQPIQPTISASGATSFCSPATVTLSSSAATGNQWYKDGAAITGATASVYTTADSGSYTVISTIDGCASAESTAVVVTVSVPPAVDPIAGAAVVCSGATIQLTNATSGGVWSTSNTSIANVDGSGRVTGVSAGTATITFTVTTRFGCATSVSKDITVIASPSKPSITTSGSTSFCAPGSVVLSSSAGSGNQWYKNGNAIVGETTSSYTATDSGIYTVIVTQNGCVSVESDQVTVTANATPSVPTLNATGNTIICEGGSVRLHTSSLTDNIWFKDGLVIPGVTGSDYIATTTGTYTVESSNTSGCVSGLSVPIVVTVNPNRIVAPIIGADRVCANASITLSNATAGGVWSSSNTGIATVDGSGEVTGIIGGTVTITYSASNTSGCVTSVSKTITVTPEPVTPVIGTSGPTSFCLPGSVVLSSSATTGNQWYKDGLPIVGATASVYTATDSGTYTVVSTQNGCSSNDSGAVVVRANGLPFLDPITGADVVCTSTTTLLSNTIPRGVWSSSNTGIATIDGSGLLTGISAGRVTITYAFTSRLSGCSSTVSKEITVTTLPSKPSITTSGATSFCAPGSVVLRSSASSGNQWYKDGTIIAGATTSTYTANDSGIYSVIVTQNGCVSIESDQVTVTANATPSVPTLNATGNTVICEGASVRLHTSSLTGNKWFKDGVEILGETGSDYIATTTGTYTVESINTTGCVSGLSVPIVVTVNPNKILVPITGADRVCANASITLSNATVGGVWSSSNTGIATVDGSGEVTGIIGGTVSISYNVTSSSGCVTSVRKNITVTPESVTPVIGTSGPTTFCIPGSVVLSSSATTGNQWYKNGAPIAGATASVYTATDSGSYRLVSTQNGCSSIVSSAVVVQANVVPVLDPITGSDVVCTSTTTFLSNTLPRGVWSSSNTGIATIDGSGLLTGISAGRVTITYTFTARLSGCSSTVSKEITVSTLPSKPSISTSGATSFCVPGSVVLRSSASSGNQWYKDGTIIAGATASTYTATDSGIYSVIVTQNNCVSLESDQVTVSANATPSVPTLNATGNTIICEGASLRLHTSSVTGNKWFKNGIEIPGETGSDYIVTTSGSYTVETINTTGCVSGTSTPVLVTVNPNKIVAPITGADRVCANASITLSNATAGGVWSSSNTGIATVDGSGEVTGIIGGTVTITYSASNTSGCVTSVSKTITVTPEPVTPVIATSGPTTFCLPGSVVLSSSATTGNQWYKDGLPITGATASVYTATDSGSYTVVSTQNGCSSIDSGAVVVQANGLPFLDPITGADVVCTGTTTLLSNTIPRGVWSSSNTGIATIDGSGLLTGISAGRVTITYTFTSRLSGCSSTVSKEITVTTLPSKPSISTSGATSFCAPGSVVLRSSASSGNQWYKDGTAIVGATGSTYTATDSGIYSVIVTQNSCVSVESDQVTVTANATPSVPTLNATGNTVICEGASVRLHTSSLTGNKWFINGIEIPGETGSDYIATTTGTYTVETINTTGCVSGTSTPVLVTVNPNKIVAPITGADRVCANASITLSNATTGGVWSSSNTGIATVDGSGEVTGIIGGTVTITYSASNTSGCVTSVSKTITVTPEPVTPVIGTSGPTTFCIPGSVVLSSSATTGNQWYKNGAPIAGETANVYTATDSGSYTVISTINGCSSIVSGAVVVKANVLPVLDPITGADVVCTSTTTLLSNTLPRGVWSSSNTSIATIDGSGLLTGVSAGRVTITYTFTARLSGCSSSVSKEITVSTLPSKPSVTAASSTSFCAPGSVVLRSSATTGNQWYKDGSTITGATTSSYTATDSGIYTVIVTQNSCVSLESDQVTVTANATPSVPTLNATGNTIICEGGSVRLHTSSLTGNKWFKDGVEILGETGSDYIATTTGTYTVETINTTGCVSGTSAPILVTVDPKRIVAPITGADRVCEGSSITLASTTTAGVWSSSNTGIASIDGSGVVTGLSAGTVTITYSASNTSGCVTSVSKTITVIAQPIQPTITASGVTSFCSPATVTLTSSAATGNQWYKDGAAITGATARVYTASDSGSYAVISTINGCSSIESIPVVVTVSVPPVVDPIVGATVVCAGNTIQLSNTILKGVWSTSNTGIATIDGSGLLTGVSAGTATITFTVTTKFGCKTSVSKDITVRALPNKPSITTSGATSFCAPGSVVLRSSATTGNQWYKDGSAITGATTSSYTATDSGIYSVIVTQNNCVSVESDQVTVTANATPSVPTLNATGNTIICEGGSVRLHTSSLAGNKWFKDGVEILGETGSDYIATTTGTYTVETINTTGCVSGTSAPILVTVDPNRIVAPITGADRVCEGSSITLASTTTAGVWSSSNTGIASIDGSGVVTGVSAGTVTITYSASNTSGCVTSVSKTITVIAQPIQPTVTASGVTSFCSPATVTLTSSAATGNQWYKDGAAITGATARVYTASDSGSYTVISTVNGCSSIESIPVVVTVSVPPVVDPIVGATVVCAGNTIQLSNTILKGVWSTSNTGIATIDGSGLLTGVSAGTATITFTVTTKFGCKTSVSKDITVRALPNKPSITTSGATSFCAPGSVVLRSSATTGNQWYKDGSAITGATTSSYTATDSGIYSVIVTQNNCVSIESDQVTVTANATPSVPTLNATGNTIICEGASVRLHTSSLTGNKWFKDGVEILGETGSDYIVTTSGSYTVETINTTGCVSGTSAPILVTVDPNRIVAPITGADRVCEGSSITLASTTTAGVWSSSNTGIASIDGSGVVTGLSAGTVTITYSASNTSGCVTSVSKTITVIAQPIQPTITASGVTSFCSPATVTLTSSAATGNQWYKDGAAITGATARVYTASDSGSYTVISTINGCSSIESIPVVVTVSVPPVVDPIVGATVVCAGNTIQLSNTILKGVWSTSNTGIATIDGSGLLTGVSAGTATITFTVTTKFGCKTSVSKDITVRALPNKPSITTSGATSFCAPGSVVLRSSATTGNQWYKDGTAIAGATTSSYTATDSGIYSVIVTQNNCVSIESDQVTVTANATPSVPIIRSSRNTTVCEGTSVRLYTSSTTGNQWLKDGLVIAGATGSEYFATTSGSYTLETINATGCVSGVSTAIQIVVSPNPVVTPITGTDTVCAGSSILLSNSTTGGVWSSSNTGIATVDGSGLLTGLSAGSVTITYSVTNTAGCTTIVSKFMTIIAQTIKPTITPASSTSFCAPGSVVLRSSTTTGNQWYKDGSAITGATTSSYTATDSGIYSVIVTQNGCASEMSDGVLVTANATPSVPIIRSSRNTTVCEGTSVRLYTSSTTGNQWLKDGLVIAGATGSEYFATTSGSYTLETINATGCVSGVSTAIQVVVSPNPVVTPITGTDTVCAGSSILLSNSTTGGVWSSSNTGIATVDGSGLVTGVSAGSVTITYSVTNAAGCTTSVSKPLTIIAQPIQPTITPASSTSFCTPGLVILNSSVSTGNQWYKDGTAIPGATASSYTATTSGSYTVQVTQNSCSSVVSNAILVTANALPVLGPISGSNSLNVGSSITLANGTSAGVWSSNNNAVATITPSGVVTGISSGSVIISYTVTNGAACTSVVTKTITVLDFVLNAVDDDFTSTPFDASKEQVLDVLANDKENNGTINAQSIVVTIVDNDGLQGVTVDSQGRVVIPAGSAIGIYILTYSICDKLNANNCSTAMITVELKDPCDFDDSAAGCDVVARNAISPNNDGLNDVFIIDRIENYPDNTVEIYNRWGQLVFKMNGYNNSSKVFVGNAEGAGVNDKNANLASGTYYYVIKYKKPISGAMKQKVGFLYISY